MKKSDRERRTDASTCKMMPVEWTPGPYEVLIGRGRRCTMHWGNQRFRAMIDSELSGYTAAQDCKRQKSSIIGRVLADIQRHSPHAGFVKKDVGTGRWLSLTDAASRVTIAQAFRDALVDTYRSSKHSKQVKRRIEKRERQTTTTTTPPPPPAKRTKREVHVVVPDSPPKKPIVAPQQETSSSLSMMPPLRTGSPMEMESSSSSSFHDSFTLVASTVTDVISDEDPSDSSEMDHMLANEEFDALFQAFAGNEVNMEDNPFEPFPLSINAAAPALPEPTPLFPSMMQQAQHHHHHDLTRMLVQQPTPAFPLSSSTSSSSSSSSFPIRRMFNKTGHSGARRGDHHAFGKNHSANVFGSAVPYRDVRAAMSA